MLEKGLGRHDRHLRLAQGVTGEDLEELGRKFLSQRVLVTGDEAFLDTREGRLTVVTALNLIVRFCPKIDIDLGNHRRLVTDSLGVLNRVDQSPNACFNEVRGAPWEEYDAVLYAGRLPECGPNVTSVVGSGWLAGVSCYGPTPDLPGGPYNPFGPLIAATFGAAEVFKRLIRARPGAVSFFSPTVFSAYSYRVYGCCEPTELEPTLPAETCLPEVFLAGAGAVGNAFAYALRNVPGVTGPCAVVDREDLDDETNLNRYLLAFHEDAYGEEPVRKVDLVARAFENTGIKCRLYKIEIDEYLKRIFDKAEPHPDVVISAVDNNDVRPSLQKLWPDLLVEGATSDSVFQVSRHAYVDELACLMCIHSIHHAAQSHEPYETQAAKRSGLSDKEVRDALHDEKLVVTPADVDAAPEDKRAFLKERVGRPICSVLTEIETLSKTPMEMPPAATVSFVSMAAGALAAAEVVKWASGIGSRLETLFQMDMFCPIENAVLQGVEKSQRCQCYTRRRQIDQYRASAFSRR
ncbi:MAG: hypothetical protein NUW12_09565 [Firmicutes bacterium]|jgi:hypothetical protein|nr:hypothetical protein [Bacillota bacterium]MDH7496236.1 hypothetical protein [Bacillota bacterium]